MRILVTLGYWAVCALLLAAIFSSLGYRFDDAFFVASAFLPGLLLLKYGSRQLAYETPRRQALHIGYLAAAALVLEYLLLFLANHDKVGFGREMAFPPLLLNPFFLLFLLGALALPEYLLDRRFARREAARPQRIDFISERRRVSLHEERILYVASNDTEVVVHTVDGEQYRTRTPISQWEAILNELRFLRIHRAYIVSRAHVTGATRTGLAIGGEQLPVSRKYADRVVRELGAGEAAAVEG